MKSPTKRSWTAIGLGLASSAVVLALVWLDLERTTPGPLSPTHARVAALADAQGCVACHGTDEDGMSAACLACHGPIAEQLARESGLHGAVIDGGERCRRCHLEHHGAELALVDARSFTLAGIPERDRFRHEGFSFTLAGRHAELACGACHELADASVLAEGERRFLGLEQRCTSCHVDPHAGTFGAGCASCHGQERPFAEAAAFEHPSAFPLAGVHARVACASCHGEPGRGLAELLAPDARLEPERARSCNDCHASPHRTGFLAALAQVEGTSIEQGCVRCHSLDGGAFARARLEPEAHALGGFALTGAHAGPACAACHEGGAAAAVRAAPDAPAPSGRACAQCHDSPHQERFLRAAVLASGLEPGASCAACHPAERRGFRRPLARLESAAHAATGFPLEAPHAALGCAACHAPLESAPTSFARSYPGRAAEDCAACHGDPHAGAFARGAFAGRGCLACHERTRFLPVAFTRLEHDATRFALEGAHEAVGCWECHRAPEGGLAASLGHARHVFGGTPLACAACHADVHGGLFAAAPGARPEAEGCARCHDARSFAGARDAFDHAWTGFALEGVHASASCVACHPRASSDAPFGSARGTRCADCHVDPHAGQFAEGGQSDCARCHAPAAGFAASRFEHASTCFALDATHAPLACAACHRPHVLSDGSSVVRYKPLGSECADCHDPRGRER